MAGNFSVMGVEAIVKGVSQFKSDMNAIGDSATGAGSKMERLGEAGLALGSSLATIGFAAATAGALALAGGLSLAVKEALNAEQVFTRIDALLLAAGDEAIMTGGEVRALAFDMRDLFGGSDEVAAGVIKAGLAMGTVSAKQMPDFIALVADLAAVMGTDTVTAANNLAQAMDDPVGAMGRFRRAGLKFNEETEAQVKALVEAGDVTGAYAVIQDYLAKKVSGGAKKMAGTFSGQLDIMKNHLLEGAESIGESFLPMLMKLEEGFGPVIDRIERFSKLVGAWITGMAALFKAAGLGAVLERIFGPAIGGQIEGIITSLTELGGTVAAKVGPFMEAVGTFISGLVTAAAPTVLENIQKMLDGLAIFWDENGDAILAILGTILKMAGVVGVGAITFISGLAAAFATLLANDPKGFLDGIWNSLVTLAETLSGMDLGPGLAAWAGVWENMKLIVTTILDRLKEAVFGVGQQMLQGLIDGVRSKMGELKKAIQDILKALPLWAQKLLKIGSPSKVFMEIGSNVTRGLSEGLMAPSVTRTLSKAMGSVMAPVMAGPAMMGGSSTDNRVGVAGNVNINSGMSAQVFDQRMREWLGA